jgi:dinuclear metal center YbgI/SA1388 family protein
MPKIQDFYNKLNELAPFKAAYSWDNVGLLVGDMNAEVKKVLLTLDVTDKITEYAIAHKIDLIISHHPVIFQGIKAVTQRKLLNLIENKIAVISAHTNLDIAKHGVNYTLAEILGLQDIQPLSMSTDIAQYQIGVYVPEDNLSEVMSAMHEAGAGVIGNYSHCATHFKTNGQYLALDGSSPTHVACEVGGGMGGEIVKLKEQKLELVCEEIHLSKVLSAMHQAHPYETPAYTVIPLKQPSPNYGLGCYGIISDISLKAFASHVKEKLNAPFVKLWLADKTEDTLIKNIAVCGGSGNSIISQAKQKADVFVSSDFTYHQLLDAPMPIIDGGHFYTENPVIYKLKEVFKDFDCEIEMITAERHDIANLKVIT